MVQRVEPKTGFLRVMGVSLLLRGRARRWPIARVRGYRLALVVGGSGILRGVIRLVVLAIVLWAMLVVVLWVVLRVVLAVVL